MCGIPWVLCSSGSGGLTSLGPSDARMLSEMCKNRGPRRAGFSPCLLQRQSGRGGLAKIPRRPGSTQGSDCSDPLADWPGHRERDRPRRRRGSTPAQDGPAWRGRVLQAWYLQNACFEAIRPLSLSANRSRSSKASATRTNRAPCWTSPAALRPRTPLGGGPPNDGMAGRVRRFAIAGSTPSRPRDTLPRAQRLPLSRPQPLARSTELGRGSGFPDRTMTSRVAAAISPGAR